MAWHHRECWRVSINGFQHAQTCCPSITFYAADDAGSFIYNRDQNSG
ncbi:hypothetical protein CsSME_00006218 [Camellia sinensis var. sinensis]